MGFLTRRPLHDLIEQTPEMLPLSGAPLLLISVGKFRWDQVMRILWG